MRALVVAREGFSCEPFTPAALSGDGLDSVLWLLSHRQSVEDFEATLTVEDIGRFVELPL